MFLSWNWWMEEIEKICLDNHYFYRKNTYWIDAVLLQCNGASERLPYINFRKNVISCVDERFQAVYETEYNLIHKEPLVI